MKPIIFEGVVEPNTVTVEDGGASICIEPDFTTENCDKTTFVRIQSYDESIFEHYLYEKNCKHENSKLGHETVQSLIGKKIKVTIEILDN